MFAAATWFTHSSIAMEVPTERDASVRRPLIYATTSLNKSYHDVFGRGDTLLLVERLQGGGLQAGYCVGA